MSFLSGFIGIVGPPNVGKSTLLNHILGTKVSIVSPKPQTTRNRIVGVYHGQGHQMVFVDTPGIHGTKTILHKSMVDSALSVFNEVDMVLVMVEMAHADEAELEVVLKDVKRNKTPCILVINKIDTGPKELVLPVIDRLSPLHPFDACVPVSALKGDGVDVLMDTLRSRLLPGPEFFPKDMYTDQSESFLVGELIREKIFYHLKKELPYSSAVTVDRMKEVPEKNLLSVSARIHVESESQKVIFIGKGGRMIKAVGSAARGALERLFGVKVFLQLTVRVEKNWSKNTKALRRLGY